MTKPQPIRIEVFEKTNCLFFDDLQTMMVSLASLILISQVFKYKKSPIIDISDETKLEKIIEIPFEGLTIREAWSFKAYQPFKGIVENTQVDRIEFNIYPPLTTPIKNSPDVHYVDQPNLFQQKIIGSAFVTFYEENKSRVEAKFTQDPNKWPTDLNFARVIRNAYSHKARINFLNPSAQPVSWRGITYSPSDNGKSIHSEIFLPEIIELMKDMAKHIN